MQHHHESSLETGGQLMDDDIAAELRADFARRRVPYYVAAPIIGLHPTILGRYLSGQRPLYPELVDRIRGALDTVTQERELVAAGQREAIEG
jgi:hypothetical protein